VEYCDRFSVLGENDPVRPITFMRRFVNLNDKTDSVILLTVDNEKCMIFSYKNMEVNPVNLQDLGTEERQAKMPYMKDFDFSGLKIVNASIAENSRYFCVGSVAEQLPEKLKRKNDQRSVVGIFKIDPKTLFTTIEMWIVDVSSKSSLINFLVSLQEFLRG